jgi:MFS family permease
MVLAQGIGGWVWGAKVDRKGPVRYMKIGWVVVTISLIGAGLVAHYVSDIILAAYLIMIILGAFQFTIAAAQVPMLPMIDTATTNAYGEGSAGLAFGAFGTAWATGTIIGPLIIGPMYDLTNSWGLTIGVLAIPMAFGLWLTLKNQEMLTECYNTEMGKRNELE